VSSTLGRPLGRPRCRASLLGHPGTSPERGGSVFLLPPAPPPPRTAFGCGGLLTLTLRGKAMDGFEEKQERNRPQLCPPSLENRRTDAGFPRASTGRRRSVAGRSLGLSLSKRTERTIDSQTLATQSTRPPNRGRFTSLRRPCTRSCACWSMRRAGRWRCPEDRQAAKAARFRLTTSPGRGVVCLRNG